MALSPPAQVTLNLGIITLCAQAEPRPGQLHTQSLFPLPWRLPRPRISGLKAKHSGKAAFLLLLSAKEPLARPEKQPVLTGAPLQSLPPCNPTWTLPRGPPASLSAWESPVGAAEAAERRCQRGLGTPSPLGVHWHPRPRPPHLGVPAEPHPAAPAPSCFLLCTQSPGGLLWPTCRLGFIFQNQPPPPHLFC